MGESARVTIEGEVMGIKEFKTKTGVGHEVQLLQKPIAGDAKSQAHIVSVAVFNGAIKNCVLGKPVSLVVTASLREGGPVRDRVTGLPTGAMYPARLGLAAF